MPYAARVLGFASVPSQKEGPAYSQPRFRQHTTKRGQQERGVDCTVHLVRHGRPNRVCRCSLLASKGSEADNRIVQRHTAYQYVSEERLRQQRHAANRTNSIAQ